MKKIALVLALAATTALVAGCYRDTDQQREVIELRKSCQANPAQEACKILEQQP